jgi:hypothetical protein
MQAGRRNAAAASGNHRLRAAARILACRVLLALAVLLSPEAGDADPASQFMVAPNTRA